MIIEIRNARRLVNTSKLCNVGLYIQSKYVKVDGL